MRFDTPEFAQKNTATTKEPIFVVALSFDTLNTDIHYLTSAPVTGLSGNIINNTLKIVSSTSQTINPDKANSTIGSIKFECLDIGLTALQRTKLGEDKGLNGKRVRVYQGYRGLLWSQYRLIQTQIISSSITYKDGVYTFNCSDIQRAMRKDVFAVKETRLAQTLEPDATVMQVSHTTGFDAVYQVPSAQAKTLLRSLQARLDDNDDPLYPSLVGVDDIGILRIDNGDDYELVIWTGKTTTTFTGLIRGVMGTRPIRIEVDTSGDQDSAPKVTEYVYLSMPAVKCAYALMTGSLYGHAGKFLPDHWHLGISTDYVQTSAFVNIGTDLWDVSNDDVGFPIDIRGAEREDGKKFIEENIYYMTGLFSPITVEGELSLKRMANVSANGSFVRMLNEHNVVSYSELTHDLKAVVNSFVLKWNWDERREIFTRTSVLQDPLSIERHGEAEPRVVELATLHGSRHSDRTIRGHFDAIRSRYAGPPLRMSVELTPDQNDLEVGDIVRVNLQAVEDFSNDIVGPIDRNFEIQSVSNDWITGRVRVTLFGSSERASDIVPDRTEAIPEAFYTGEGVSLISLVGTAGVPNGSITSSGGVTTISANIELTGNALITHEDSIFYCSEDLTINGGVVVTINNNVQIRANGFLSLLGEFDGVGRGGAGGTPVTSIAYVAAPQAANLGGTGIGMTQGGGGWTRVDSVEYHGHTNPNDDDYDPDYYYSLIASGVQHRRVSSNFSSRSVGANVYQNPGVYSQGIDHIDVAIDEEGALIGMPSRLNGAGGSSGMPIYHLLRSGAAYTISSVVAQGGAGGAGGAGLALFSRGMEIGINGVIDLSGLDGNAGSTYNFGPGNAVAGAGAGGQPGNLIIGVLDSSQTFPVLNDANAVMNEGISPYQYAVWVSMANHPSAGFWRWAYDPNVNTSGQTFLPASSPLTGSRFVTGNRRTDKTAFKFLDNRGTSEEDQPDYVENDPTFSLTEFTNTPVTPDGNQSTIEVSVTPPADTNYAYALVDYRKLGTTGWLTTSASNEALIQVESDGSTYEIQVRAVSTKGFASPTGPIDTVTVTDVNGRTDDELDDIYPFYPITGLSLQNETGDIFTGRDAAFEWSHDNAALIYFNYYEIEMYSGAQLLRTEKSASPWYNYAYEKNALDYQRINGVPGIYWELEVRVKAVSKYLNSSNEWYSGPQVSFEVTAPVVAAPDVTLSYSGANVVLTWPNYGNQFLTITTTLEYSGNVIMETTGNSFTIPVNWTGSRTFNVRAAHLPTRSSAVVEVVVNPVPPGVPVVTSQVIANNILFSYASTPGSLPIDRYEIRRGGTYNSGTTPDTKAGSSSFTVYTETVAGTIVFWFEAVDTAGNHGGYVSSSVSVSSPPNYQLLATYSAKDAGWPGTKTNALVTELNNLLVPVNTTETFQQHFDNNSWSTPQDQVTAGFEYYIQPSTNSAQYVVTYDYGSSIDSAILSATTAPVVFDGAVTAQVTLAWSADNSSWTSATAGQTQALATSFRYARVTIDITASGGDDLAYIEDVLIKLDKQVDEDFGSLTATSSDTNGTFIEFNKDFIDANTPTVTINAGSISGSTDSTPIRAEAIIRFVDEPDPTGFYIYVYNAANGNRVTATGSWHVYGFTRT